MKAKIGLITGIISEEIRRDVYGTFERLAEIGYEGIEGSAVLLGGVEANRRKREALGLQAVSLGVKHDRLEDEIEPVIEQAVAAGALHVVVWWGPCESAADLLRDAERYNLAGRKCTEAGLRFCYHNHEHELRRAFDGRTGLEVLLAHTDPQHVGFELDVGWVLFGGVDPAAFLGEHADRVALVHLKDVADLDERGHFTAVGTGLLDVRAVVSAGLGGGTEWFVVEQDRPHNLSPMDSVTASMLNLREMGLA